MTRIALSPGLYPKRGASDFCFVTKAPVASSSRSISRLVADTSASDLPDSHDGVVVFGVADSVNLNVAGIAIVSKLKNVP
jgi:hypothetical protein